MSNFSLFKKVPIKVPNKSGFDMSHENMLTLGCGTLVPVLTDFLLPGDSISCGEAHEIQLPPMATDFYGRVRLKFESFFVPCRLLYGGWQEMMTVSHDNSTPSGSSVDQKGHVLPSINIAYSKPPIGPGSLADYLGFKVDLTGDFLQFVSMNNFLRFMAYHKIYEDWYRDTRIQKSIFRRVSYNTSVATNSVAYLPFVNNSLSQPSMSSVSDASFADGVSLFSLRQRNWARDYFTNATLEPQAGDGASLSFSVDTESGDGSFTIASLRAANALQQWLERNNIAGNRYSDQIYAHFGVLPPDSVMDRAVYLGSASSVIYNHSVYQTNDFSGDESSVSKNPFSSVASKYSSPIGTGKSSLCDKFTAKEHGYFMVIASIVPDAVYGTGVNRDFFRSSFADFAWPELQGVGDQPINKLELSGTNSRFIDTVFGYTQRYSEYKFMLDEVHGLLRDGQSLEAFCLKRSFADTQSVSLSSSFLQIPTNFLDDVAAVAGESVSNFGAWADIFFRYHKVSCLSAYTIPTLGDPQNTHTVMIDNGGRRL